MDARDREHPPAAGALSGWPLEPLGVRIRDAGEIAAALPHLLGFRPRESVVLVSLGGASGRRVGLTVRADIPSPGARGRSLAAVLARSLCTDGPDGALVLVVSEAADDDAGGRRATSRTGSSSGRWCAPSPALGVPVPTRCWCATAGGGPTTARTPAALPGAGTPAAQRA